MDDSKVFMFPNGGNNNGIDATTALLLGNGGGFGNGFNNPLWMMFMYPFIMPFLSMYGGGFGGFGGFGGGYGADLLGTGFISNQLNNNNDKNTILNALQYNREAISLLAQLTGNSISDVRTAIDIANSKLGEIGAQVGMSGLQVINAIQAGDANLGRQLCECCCNMRYDLSQQTNALQNQAANNFASTQLQMAQNEAADQLSVCQQTNALSTQADRNANSILNAINGQNALIVDQFCQLKERELQNKIDTQGDIITQLRGQISNDMQTEKFNAAFRALDDKIDAIAAKTPNTVPVQWPQLTAVSTTPNFWGWNNGWGSNSFWN